MYRPFLLVCIWKHLNCSCFTVSPMHCILRDVTEKSKNIFLTLHTTLNKTMQKLSAKLSKRCVSHGSLEKEGPEGDSKIRLV